MSLSAPKAFASTLPLATLPVFSDATHAVLPVTFRRGTRAAVSFLRSGDGGATWRPAATVTGRRAPTPTGRLPAAVPGATDWIALPDGGSRAVGLENGKLARTVATVGLPLAAPGFELTDVAFSSATIGWATVSTCTAGSGPRCARGEALYRTVDGGRTWARLSLPG